MHGLSCALLSYVWRMKCSLVIGVCLKCPRVHGPAYHYFKPLPHVSRRFSCLYHNTPNFLYLQTGMDETSAAETGAESDTGRKNRSSAPTAYTNTAVLQEAVRHIRSLKQQGLERHETLENLRAVQARLKQRLQDLESHKEQQ